MTRQEFAQVRIRRLSRRIVETEATLSVTQDPETRRTFKKRLSSDRGALKRWIRVVETPLASSEI